MPKGMRELGDKYNLFLNASAPTAERRVLIAEGIAWHELSGEPHIHFALPTGLPIERWANPLILAGLILIGDSAAIIGLSPDQIAAQFGVTVDFVTRWLSLIGGS